MTKLMHDLVQVSQQATAVVASACASSSPEAIQEVMASLPSAGDGIGDDMELNETPQVGLPSCPTGADGARRRANTKLYDPQCQIPCNPAPGFHV
eukprot:7791207-Alexandrium_andersonii.AAC.1